MARALSEIPAGTALLLDANIFIYAFEGGSEQCVRFERCRIEELVGATTGEVIGEVCHRLMVREAFEGGLVARPAVGSLRSRPEVVRALRKYWEFTVRIFRSNLLLLGSVEQRHLRAQGFGASTDFSLTIRCSWSRRWNMEFDRLRPAMPILIG